MNNLIINPINKFQGDIEIPGSKSISNRVLILLSLLNKRVRLQNVLFCDDVNYMMNALIKLNVNIEKISETDYYILGNLLSFNNDKIIDIYVGNSGTTMRFLLSILSCIKCNIILDGDSRMKERPIGDLVNSLRMGGAKIYYLEKENYPPINVRGGFNGNNICIRGNISSQFISSLLMIMPFFKKNSISIKIIGELISKPYVDMTISLLKYFNIFISNDNYKYFKLSNEYKNDFSYYNDEYKIEGDLSSASYFIAAGVISGGPVKINNINKNSIQGDIKFIDIVNNMGGNVKLENNFIKSFGKKKKLTNINLDMNSMPDVAMTLSIICLFCKKKSIINNIYSWRLKETDRLLAMSTELTKIGAIIEEGYDYISIIPPKKFIEADIETYNDHRIAMCFSLIALSGVKVNILNPECVNKTFPKYFDLFQSLIIK